MNKKIIRVVCTVIFEDNVTFSVSGENVEDVTGRMENLEEEDFKGGSVTIKSLAERR